jgi:hypothetical protein
MSTFTRFSLVLPHFHSAHHLEAENARNQEERAHALVLLDIFSDTLGLALAERLTFN